MMRCSDDLMQLYVDGALHPAEAAVVEAHLQECAQCRRRSLFYKGLAWDLGQPERLVPGSDAEDEDQAEALALRLHEEWRRHQRPAEVKTALGFSTMWLTANPAIARPARVVSDAGQAGVEELLRAGRRGLARLLRRKGVGSR